MVVNEKKLEMNKNRTLKFKRFYKLEKVLSEVNTLIENINTITYSRPKYPVIFIIGCPRSGSTLLLQWLASLKLFGYPTNLIARFYKNPYLGARIQQILIDYDINQQINLSDSLNPFNSKLGKTWGALSPSEFWYFWRRFFKFGEIQRLKTSELKKINHKRFVADIAALESIFNKPIVMKGMIMNWHIPYLSKIFKKKCFFINIERQPIYNAQSLYISRIDFFNNPKRWFSYKPPEYCFLKKLSPLAQVAGQVYYTTNAIKIGLKKIPQNQFINIQYENFCREPVKYFELIKNHLSQMNYNIKGKYIGKKSFKINNRIKLKKSEIKEIIDQYSKFSGNFLKI